MRIVQYDVSPGPKFGASAVGDGYCDKAIEQLMYFTDTNDFSLAKLKEGATVTRRDLALPSYSQRFQHDKRDCAI